MKYRYINCFRVAAAAALLISPLLAVAQTAPIRSYAISGTENSRYFDPALGWIEAANTFTGNLDLITAAEARLTKVYEDGTTVVRDLILHWTVDLNVISQGGTAAEVPDPSDPIIKRTIYNLGLQFDGVRHTAVGNFQTRAWMSVIPGFYDWFNVAYGNFEGFVISPLGDYNIAGSEKAGKTLITYTGILRLLSPTSASLTKVYKAGGTSTVHLALESPVDTSAEIQSVTAAQLENQPGQSTVYELAFQRQGTSYVVDCSYLTVQAKGKTTRTLVTGAFTGSQELTPPIQP